ncbi:Protein ImpG/VasA [Rhodovastum atsumiense]|uniref:Type VI secretion system baseplate subunit TssF n=1 Tax=Rhodovastum atsumiense TaxID=504468 RepID=A0A5M6IWW2_9PROT|nr:type VI secretion system baseplate subunit TssF [Rhodovastum atsumiense]KAA5612731.1 type VI secretion system baseplate subunit TssF [Rhodovastum atsumiense]CAH2602712.1 Protein ImpG/VasA [Rhodovastum atsumiense]
MSDSLLPVYNRELDALRTLAGSFAEAHPKVAGRLRLGPGVVDDPHVARLLEGVAFLCARVQQRLDDEFPEITDALLGALYPHYLAPVPAAAIVQFAARPDLRVKVTLPAGTKLETDPVRGEPCRFRTTGDTTLWPVTIESARLTGLPLAAPANPAAKGARSVLRVVLSTTDPDVTFAALAPATLRLFLRGPAEQSLALYELLCGHLLGAALANGPNDDRPTLLPPSLLRPVGFAPEDALYPWSARAFSGFRLLTEYFALPEKFLFLDLTGLDARTLVQESHRLELFLYFDAARPELERRLPPDCLALGCTPVVNLFRQPCEPVRLDYHRTEYPVVPDARRPAALEVWSVERVNELRDDGTTRPWQPFYRQATGPGTESGACGFYLLSRRDSPGGPGSDVLLAPFDPALSVDRPAEGVLSVDALCSNRDLPGELPFGGGQPRLHLPEGSSAVAAVTCLTAPGASLRAPLREQRSWRLISHLSLGQVSLVGGPAAAESLREMLRLYDLRDTEETRAAIAALVGVRSRPGTARVPGARPGSFCRGLDVTLEFEPRAWESGGLYLLASVLSRFLALHATVNSFVRTECVLQGRPGVAARFAPLAGARVLL